MSAAHTPGPWHVGNGDIFAEGNKSSDFDDIVICAIGLGGGFRSHEYAVVKAHRPEGKANARLIASAPELLEALEAFNVTEKMIVAGTADSLTIKVPIAVIQQAAAAIAKATGGAA